MTYQRPAYEEVTIAHGGNTVMLRPSLRAAATLEGRHGFPALFRGLEEGSFTIMSDIILAACSSRQDAAAFLGGNLGKPLLPFFLAVRQPLDELVSMFMPAPVQSLDTAPHTGKEVPWSEVCRNLYRVATGQLRWTPEVAWSATPTEINEAFIGRFGTGEDSKKAPDPEQAARNIAEGLDPEFDRAGLRALKAKIASS